MLLPILIAVFAVSLISLIGVVLVWFRKDHTDGIIRYVVSFAAGVMLAAALLGLLPEAVEHAEPHLVFTILTVSIIAMFVLEQFLHWHHCHSHTPHSKKKPIHPVGYMNLVGDGVHNLLDGALIAGAFLTDFSLGIITTLAVILHEIPQEISDFGVLLHAGFTKGKALLFNLLFALTAVVGAIATFFAANVFESIEVYLVTFAAGSFLYIALTDLIPEIHREHRNALTHFILLILGVLVMASIGSLLGH